MECHLAFVLISLLALTRCSLGNTIPRTTTIAPNEKTKSNICITYTQTGEGNFKLQRKHYTSLTHGYYIKDVQLLERSSFYKCEPKSVKYGLDIETNTWWVDKGCEGLFNIVVCPDSVARSHPHPENWRGTVYSELLLQLETAVKPIDWTHFNMKGVENRFKYQATST